MKDLRYTRRRVRLKKRPATGTYRVGSLVVRSVGVHCQSAFGHALYRLDGDLVACVRCHRIFAPSGLSIGLLNADAVTMVEGWHHEAHAKGSTR